jgi:hypothetical protein
MATRNYASINPWSGTKCLPKLSTPGASNGKMSTSDGFTKFQWCPTDTPEAAGDDYRDTHDEMFYTVNRQNFRADQFKKINDKPVLMCLGDSFTYGIGVRDAETWPSILADRLGMVNWNMGTGGASNQDIYLIFQQMISNGYIPDVVCIMWSYNSRQIVSRNVISPLIEETDIMPEWRRTDGSNPLTEIDINAFSKKVDQLNTLRELNTAYYNIEHRNINKKITTFWNGTGEIGIATGDQGSINWNSVGSTELPEDKSLMKSALYTSIHTDSDYLNFFIVRSAIANICKARGIKMRETFLDMHLQKFALAHIVPVEGWQTGKYPINTCEFNLDRARDQEHYGPKTLEAVATYYMSTI